MSRAKILKSAIPAIALVGAACASSPATPELTAEEQAYQDAIEEALKPASEEEIALAERSDPITRANFWASEYQKDPSNLDVSVSFMKALRGIGSYDRVIEVANVTVPIHPTSYELYLELGRTMMKQDDPAGAAQAFVRSADRAPVTEAAPLAALGVAFDRLEDHAKAQEAYQLALERDPYRVSTLSNYGLSLALTGRLAEAESALRQAVELPGADVRVRQNLALILGLQGRFDEMTGVDPTAPRRSIEANRRALEEMIIPTGSFDDLKNINEVLSDLERTPAAAQTMPGVPEADVVAEGMSDLSPAGEELSGDASSEPKSLLRGTLRGAQGR